MGVINHLEYANETHQNLVCDTSASISRDPNSPKREELGSPIAACPSTDAGVRISSGIQRNAEEENGEEFTVVYAK
jgi:hypothetical protein